MAPKADMLATYQMVGLPVPVVSKVDVGRLLRELEQVDAALSQATLRSPGATFEAPKASSLFEKTLKLNKLDVLQAADRQRLQQFLEAARNSAPVLNFSFSVDPSQAFMEKLIVWLRREIHPLMLVTIGLQPNIGAGCVVRSTNKYFDMSLRQAFNNKQDMLRDALLPAATPAASQEPVAAPVEVAA